MGLDGFGEDNLLALTSQPHAADVLSRLQLVALSVAALTGIGLLARRRRGAGPPLRRSVALLVDSFGLALLLIAVLLLHGAFGGVNGEIPFETTRRVTFFVIGLAPLAFLVGLLHARLARSAVGDLAVELRADLAPADLREALARALRDPSLTLAYWLPDFGTYADSDGRRVELPGPEGRRVTTLVERDGAAVTVLLHDRSLEDEPELLAAVTAAGGIALENAQLQVELRARLEELRGSRARIVEAGDRERQRLERNLHDGAQQRLVALSLELGLLEGKLERGSERARPARPGAGRDRRLAGRAPRARARHPSGRGQRPRARRGPRAAGRPGPGARAPDRGHRGAPPRGARGRGLLRGVREPGQRRQVRAGVVGHRGRSPVPTVASSSR